MKCKFYAQKGNEQKERDTCDRFNLTGLDSYLLEFTTRNLRGFVKNSENYAFFKTKSPIEQHLGT